MTDRVKFKAGQRVGFFFVTRKKKTRGEKGSRIESTLRSSWVTLPKKRAELLNDSVFFLAGFGFDLDLQIISFEIP